MTTVLIVEDQSSVAEVVKHHLESSGFQVVTADNVETGWRCMFTHQPDAALVDIRLPGPDGWTLIEQIRADERFKKLPTLVLTGLLEADVLDRAAALDCQYLSKPFSASALVHKVQGMLRGAHNGQTLETPEPNADEAGDKVNYIAHRAVMLMDRYQIRGTVYVPSGLKRFSDAWEALLTDGRDFIPVTDATITSPDPGSVMEANFVQVRKEHIRAIFPRDAER